jgi:hypothetical protein
VQQPETEQFFRDIIGSGAILAGFCATFLVFRIQREADFYRTANDPKGTERNEQHFTSSFLLIIFGTLAALCGGFLIPLLFLAGVQCFLLSPRVSVAALLASTVLIAGYVCNELVHYHITEKADPDWRAEKKVWLSTLLVAVLVGLLWLLFAPPLLPAKGRAVQQGDADKAMLSSRSAAELCS